ncbi:MAG: M28 family metallopeptidase [Pseudomonadota bacterium]
MIRSLSAVAVAAMLLSGCATPRPYGDAAQIEADMSFLADDALLGREAGSEGYQMAADYVRERMQEIGLKPAGDDGSYFQQVPLQRSVRVADAVYFGATDAAGEDFGFEENKDVVVYGSRSFEESDITAEAVFVGFGIVAPDLGRDDYEGLDVDGKIVVMLSGTPKGIQSEERAYYGTRKSKNASDRGAIGILSVETPTRKDIYPFERLLIERRMDGASMGWLQKDGTPFSLSPGIEGYAYMGMPAAEKLFRDAPVPFAEIMEMAEAEGGLVKGFDLPVEITIRQKSEIDTVTSPNVAGIIEGTAPELKDEVIVLTAHLDHIGLAKTIEDDKINNGALDNAAGVSTLLDAARMLVDGPPLGRSIMVLAVTAEEKGLLGAQYFANNPTVPAESIVANVNLDMPVLTYEFTDLIVFGAARSTIADLAESAAAELDVTLSPDPFPEQGIFTRSDHFRFVEAGIPSVYLIPGFENGGEAEAIRHRTQNYHRPSDDMSNSIDFDAAAKFSTIKARITEALANADERPLWKKDDFFAVQFGGPMEE